MGRNKQIATAWLIAEFGKHNHFLKKTAEKTLTEYQSVYGDDPLHHALTEALAWLPIVKASERTSCHGCANSTDLSSSLSFSLM